jgi:hypothetical protein
VSTTEVPAKHALRTAARAPAAGRQRTARPPLDQPPLDQPPLDQPPLDGGDEPVGLEKSVKPRELGIYPKQAWRRTLKMNTFDVLRQII